MKEIILYIRFILAIEKVKKDGTSPLYCRLTLNKHRKQFYTGISLNPETWSSKKQAIVKNKTLSNTLNIRLDQIRYKINQIHIQLSQYEESISLDHIINLYKGQPKAIEKKTLNNAFDFHNENMYKLLNIDYTFATYRKFIETQNHLRSFIQFKYQKDDFLLEELRLNFLEAFERYLKVEKNLKQITINKMIQRLRKVIKLSISEDYLLKDPFILYKPKKVVLKLVYLTNDELTKLQNWNFQQIRLEQVKDMFIFCCFTGLPYQEMARLKSNHIQSNSQNEYWIEMKRKKTGRIIYVPLLPPAIEILSKYKNEPQVLPVISNQKFNSYLKEIADIIGINKRLTHHVARKTFATTVLLANDIPMEIVSELLGHSKISTTQEHYAEVVRNSVNIKMNELKNKL